MADDEIEPLVFSALLAIIFAVVGMGLFIYFIHHIASTVQVSTIASTVAAEAWR